jgi:hypothetical protein
MSLIRNPHERLTRIIRHVTAKKNNPRYSLHTIIQDLEHPNLVTYTL